MFPECASGIFPRLVPEGIVVDSRAFFGANIINLSFINLIVNCYLTLFLTYQRPEAVADLMCEGKLGDVLPKGDAVVLEGDKPRVQAPVSARQLSVELADSAVICQF